MITKCSIIIYDDYNNILITQRGKSKKNSPELWSVFSKDIKGTENTEKVINKLIDKDLKCNIFDLTEFKKYVTDEENDCCTLVYTGKIREAVSCSTEIKKVKWLSKREADDYQFCEEEKIIVEDFFSI